jgi:hypothetical protein
MFPGATAPAGDVANAESVAVISIQLPSPAADACGAPAPAPRGCRCCSAPHALLFWVAALVWALGAWACGDTALTLLLQALAQGAAAAAAGGAVAAGVAAGAAATVFLFAPLARANVDRIDALPEPRLYDTFRLKFLLGLCLFDGGTVTAQIFLAKSPPVQLSMAALNTCVATGLGATTVYIVAVLWCSFGKERKRQGGGGGLLADDSLGDVEAGTHAEDSTLPS